MKWFGKVALISVVLGLLALGLAEMSHHRKFGHFVGYGLHTDVILGNSDIGSNDTYIAKLTNFAAKPFDIEGCVFPSDVVGVPDSVLYRWDVQKWDPSSRQWISLRGADTWVQKPFGGYWSEEPCRSVITQIRPFQSQTVAWVYKDWVTTGDPVRMAIHTSATLPPEGQQIVYTDTFIVKRPTAKSN